MRAPLPCPLGCIEDVRKPCGIHHNIDCCRDHHTPDPLAEEPPSWDEIIADLDQIAKNRRYWYHARPHRIWQRHSPAQVTEIDVGSRIERCACGAMRPTAPFLPLRLSGWVFGSDRRRTIRQWKRDQS